MPWSRRAFVLGCGGLLVAGVVRSAPARPVVPSVWWRTSYRDSRQEASQRRRPLALVFWAENDPWCKTMDMTTFRDPEVVDVLNHKYIPVRIDCAAAVNKTLVDWLSVREMPTTVVADHAGGLVNSSKGYLDPMMYLGFLRRSHILCGSPGEKSVTAR